MPLLPGYLRLSPVPDFGNNGSGGHSVRKNHIFCKIKLLLSIKILFINRGRYFSNIESKNIEILLLKGSKIVLFSSNIFR